MHNPDIQWHPVCLSADLNSTSVALGFLQGEELALWRANDGAAQAWANRCPHRGVRFTLGRVQNGRLACAYHGWEYQAGNGRCATIPAHPQAPAPRNVCAQTYPLVEAGGMIWVSRATTEEAPPAPAVHSAVRVLAIRAAMAPVLSALLAAGWQQVAPLVLRATLAEVALTAFVSEAGQQLVLLQVGSEAPLDPKRAPAVHAALRRLRDQLESQP